MSVALMLLVLATACQATAEITMATTAGSGETVNGRAAAPRAQDGGDGSGLTPVSGGGIDFSLERDDLDCRAANLDIYDELPFVVAHVVVDGNLGASCFGQPDERLLKAWRILANITPPDQLHDLGVFAGFVSDERDQTTLAFVTELNAEVPQYQMSVNLEEASLDSAELMTTMAHEFAHVFITKPSQIDTTVYPKDCPTWHNLRGCYSQDSLMWAWVDRFWSDGLIDEVNPKQAPSLAIGNERCRFHGGFLGPYAASHPEEDFAESFSAFVFRIEVDTPELREKMAWFAQQPRLAEFRNRAVESDLGPVRNLFESCG